MYSFKLLQVSANKFFNLLIQKQLEENKSSTLDLASTPGNMNYRNGKWITSNWKILPYAYLIDYHIMFLDNGLCTFSKIIFKSINHTVKELNHKQRRNCKTTFLLVKNTLSYVVCKNNLLTKKITKMTLSQRIPLPSVIQTAMKKRLLRNTLMR